MHAIRAPYAFNGSAFMPAGAKVLVEGDRIIDVDEMRCSLPTHVEVTHYPGAVLPGLIDCHAHLVADATFGGLERAGTMNDEELDAVIEKSLRAHAEAGVTTVRDLGDVRYRTLAWREVAGLPLVVAAGSPITTPGGHCQSQTRRHVPGSAPRGPQAGHAGSAADGCGA